MVTPNDYPSLTSDSRDAANVEQYPPSWILAQLQQGCTFKIDTHTHNGLILCKPFHADFAGPGATIGGDFDLDCQQIIAIGDLSVQLPISDDDSQKAYRIRRAWMRLLNEFTKIPSPRKRAKKILTQFEIYFGKDITDHIPDNALAKLVGVLPQTIQAARYQ
ncbi:MAG: hypothetical protein AAGD25_25470 [Cyanobacteria bacterium P01_F01_bin.150]